ncbi:hypothetical protein SBBP2_170002 [Burkholderiales bacterium]|nr:hypothetical protein SBBP2_170002 [Burkholderiales bacterium]
MAPSKFLRILLARDLEREVEGRAGARGGKD